MFMQQIEELNQMVRRIIWNQTAIVTMLENKSLPGYPSLIPFMKYDDEIIYNATRFYMHILITRHVSEMIAMWVDVEKYADSKYADQIENKLSELISLCTGSTFLELTEKFIWKSLTENS